MSLLEFSHPCFSTNCWAYHIQLTIMQIFCSVLRNYSIQRLTSQRSGDINSNIIPTEINWWGITSICYSPALGTLSRSHHARATHQPTSYMNVSNTTHFITLKQIRHSSSRVDPFVGLPVQLLASWSHWPAHRIRQLTPLASCILIFELEHLRKIDLGRKEIYWDVT